MLQSIYNLSDESVIQHWTQNVYFQAFSGALCFTLSQPFTPSTLCNFRKKVGKDGLELIFAESVRCLSLKELDKELIIDSTAQEKYTSYPTDTKLRLDVINQCLAIGSHLDIKFDRDYTKDIAELKKLINFSKNPRSEQKKLEKEEAKNSIKDIANNLLDQVSDKVDTQVKNDPEFVKSINNYRKAVNQKRNDKNKIYSVFEPHIACIAKGKSSKKFEFGTKVSIGIGLVSKAILSVECFNANTYDGDTIARSLEMTKRCLSHTFETVYGDLGYRGRPEVLGAKVLTPADLPRITDSVQREVLVEKLTKRSSVEPVIGHLKSDYGLNRNLSRNFEGDHINALRAATGFNLKKYINGHGAKALGAVGTIKSRRAKIKTKKVPFIKPKQEKVIILLNKA